MAEEGVRMDGFWIRVFLQGFDFSCVRFIGGRWMQLTRTIQKQKVSSSSIIHTLHLSKITIKDSSDNIRLIGQPIRIPNIIHPKPKCEE